MSADVSLAELQSSFTRYLLAGDNEADLAAHIGCSRGITAETRLDVYRNAYFIRLVDSLAHDFPALVAVLGDDAFGRLAVGYLHAHPSTRPSLRDLGRYLAEWLRMARGEPALADLVALEWAVLHAFDAADAPPMAPEDLATVPATRWPALRLELHPSVTLLGAHANVHEAWLAARQGRVPAPLEVTTENLVIARSRSGAPAVDAVDARWLALLGMLEHRATIGDACQSLSQTMPSDEVPVLVGHALHHAVARGWVRGMSV